jgi:hypothetical protein
MASAPLLPDLVLSEIRRALDAAFPDRAARIFSSLEEMLRAARINDAQDGLGVVNRAYLLWLDQTAANVDANLLADPALNAETLIREAIELASRGSRGLPAFDLVYPFLFGPYTPDMSEDTYEYAISVVISAVQDRMLESGP